MSQDRKGRIRFLQIAAACFGIAVFLLLSSSPVLSQKPWSDNSVPKYDLQTETKSKGVVDEVKSISSGARKDITELILKSGDIKINVYVCPKPFQEEMGIVFTKGEEIAVTGSRVKQETAEVILARELIKGTDTLMLRDSKGNPVWDARTGK